MDRNVILRACEAKMVQRVIDAVLHGDDFNEVATVADITMVVRINDYLKREVADGE